MVLVAVCDANYCFTLFNLVQCGSNTDIEVLLNCKLGQTFDGNSRNVPNMMDDLKTMDDWYHIYCLIAYFLLKNGYWGYSLDLM